MKRILFALFLVGIATSITIHADNQSLIPKSSNVPTLTQGSPMSISRDMPMLLKGLMENLIKEAHADNGCPDGYPYDCGNGKCCSLPLCCPGGRCCPAGKPWSCPYNSETGQRDVCYPEPDTDEGLAWLRNVCAELTYCR
jgi:hypothetical protein